jgi:hypothetical protein
MVKKGVYYLPVICLHGSKECRWLDAAAASLGWYLRMYQACNQNPFARNEWPTAWTTCSCCLASLVPSLWTPDPEQDIDAVLKISGCRALTTRRGTQLARRDCLIGIKHVACRDMLRHHLRWHVIFITILALQTDLQLSSTPADRTWTGEQLFLPI